MRRNRLRIYLHFVWATYNRLPLISAEVERRLYRQIESVAIEAGCNVLAIGGMPDHVHLLVMFTNTLTVAEFMKRVKGNSSRFLSEMLGAGSFQWQANYGAFSVSPNLKQTLINYIRNQKQHHAEGTLFPAAEECDEPAG